MRDFIIFRIAYLLVRLLGFTYRFKFVGADNRQKAANRHPKGSYIFASWHEYVLVAVLVERFYGQRALASRSFAGRLSGYILKKVGFEPVYGSQKRGNKDRGGKEAREQMLDGLAEGIPSALLPDASVGPRRVAKPGACYLAKKSGSAILPFYCYADRYWRLKSWDRMLIPKPFATITCVYRDPFSVPSDVEGKQFEEHTRRLTHLLTPDPA